MKNLTMALILGIISVLTISCAVLFTYAENVNRDISDSVLRLHILAASDTDHDQQLKLKVRDRIIRDYGSLFNNAKNADDGASLAEKSLTAIETSARDELQKFGSNDEVHAEVTNCSFPTRTYGSVTLPAGKYRALRIVIGEGEGQNWWCVMFPPLCFTDGILEIPEESDEVLRENLTNEEYRLITEGAHGADIKFKIVEIIGSLTSK